jgi:hypothetical protein
MGIEGITKEKGLLMGGCQTYGLQAMGSAYVRHPPILSLQEQSELGGLKISNYF